MHRTERISTPKRSSLLLLRYWRLAICVRVLDRPLSPFHMLSRQSESARDKGNGESQTLNGHFCCSLSTDCAYFIVVERLKKRA